MERETSKTWTWHHPRGVSQVDVGNLELVPMLCVPCLARLAFALAARPWPALVPP